MKENEKSILAFPCDRILTRDGSVASGTGMTLRDYFAAKWLAGYMANADCYFSTREEAAEQAYLMADAMLKARAA